MDQLTQFVEILEPGRVRLTEERSREPDPELVRIRVEYCGVCTSDLVRIALYDGEPARVGHEISGIVESAPKNSPLRPGEHVVGIGNGGYATEVDLAPAHVLRIPTGLSLLDASLAEPIACALLAVEHLDLMHTERVCVIGSGFIGLLVVRALVLRGLEVMVIEPRERARRLALDMGASSARDPSAGPNGTGEEADVVLECTGTQSGLDVATLAAAGDGQLGIIGWHQRDQGVRQIDVAAWNAKALRVMNLHGRSIDHHMIFVGRALSLLAGGHFDAHRLITETVGLPHFPKWLDETRHPDSIKTVLHCSLAR